MESGGFVQSVKGFSSFPVLTINKKKTFKERKSAVSV